MSIGEEGVKKEMLQKGISELELSKSKVEEELLGETAKANSAMVKNRELRTSQQLTQDKLKDASFLMHAIITTQL